MSEGVAMFCYNSDFAYSNLCNFNIKQIQKYLGLPVTVYTDPDTASHIKGGELILTQKPIGNNRYFVPQQRSIPWYNINRREIFYDPPYDKTLVLDVDYIVMSDCLKQVLHTDYDFMCYRNVRDATGMRRLESSSVGHSNIDFCWATVMLVTKSQRCVDIGKMIGYIQKNYRYFMRLYRVSDSNTYRNDYALSIALHQLNGFRNDGCYIPGHLVTIPDDVDTVIEDGKISFTFDRNMQKIQSYLKHTDVHVLNKEALHA